MAVREFDLETLVLKSGGHRSFKDGACLLEAAAFMAGERHSDHPECVSEVLAAGSWELPAPKDFRCPAHNSLCSLAECRQGAACIENAANEPGAWEA